MATNVTLNGNTYSIPAVGDSGWGASLSSYLVAIASGTLQKSGGAFTLTAEVDFGTTYGLKSPYFKSRGSTVSTTGALRLQAGETIAWRDTNLGLDIPLTYDQTSGRVTIFGQPVISLALGAANTVLRMNASGTNPEFAKLLNADIDSSAAIAVSKLAALTASRAVATNASGVLTPSLATSVELDYLAGVTSAIQSQLNLKQPLNAELTALAAANSTGVVCRTGVSTYARRLVAANSTKLTVTNGDGISGNILIDVDESQFTHNNIGGTLGHLKGGTGLSALGTGLQVLRVNAAATALEFASLAAGGDVTGPASSTDNGIPRFDGTTGKILHSSAGVISDAGVLSGITLAAADVTGRTDGASAAVGRIGEVVNASASSTTTGSTTNNTYTNITGTDITITAGLWLILGFASVSNTTVSSGGTISDEVSIYNVTDTTTQSAGLGGASSSGAPLQYQNVSLHVVVSVSGSKTYRLRHRSLVAGGTPVIGAGAAIYGSLSSNTHARITAIRIA